MNTPMSNLNFPLPLDIHPSAPSADASQPEHFDITCQEQAIRDFGIAGRIWEAAYALNTYLKPPKNISFDPPFTLHTECNRLIELGSGTGLNAAMVATLLHDDILFATDLPEVCPLLERNLASHRPVLVRPLAWGNSQHALDIQKELQTHHLTHILCSDLVYFPLLLAPLLRSLIQLTSPSFGDPQVIISYRIRSLAKETPFWSAFGLWFDFAPVLVQDTENTSWRRFGAELPDPTFVFVAHRRKESFNWTVPASDADLLTGVFAQGSQMPKGDDTFETLLLMSLDEL
ncbi:putative methyltransferase-domain-containing protein, partial [Mycena amicta]